MDDFDLLRQFQNGSEGAFALLVKRNVNAVYSVALRTVRSPQLAEEVTFSVFNDLARNAPHLKTETPLVAWLFRVTRRTALDVVRKEERRKRRESLAAEHPNTESGAPAQGELPGVLEAAIEDLKASDREVILLRFFQERDLPETARILGVTKEAAQKRIERALDRLRKKLARRGFGVNLAGLAGTLSASAIQAAPSGVASMISVAAKISSTTALSTHVSSIAFMTATQKAALILITTGLLTTAVYQQIKLANASKDLRQASEALVSLGSQLSDAETALARERSENHQLKEQNREIHRLRGELAARNAPPSPKQMEPVANAGKTVTEQYLNRVDQLKRALEMTPESFIPEMSLIREREWLEAAIVMQESAEDGLQKAMAHLRTLAKGKYSSRSVEPCKGLLTKMAALSRVHLISSLIILKSASTGRPWSDTRLCGPEPRARFRALRHHSREGSII